METGSRREVEGERSGWREDDVKDVVEDEELLTSHLWTSGRVWLNQIMEREEGGSADTFRERQYNGRVTQWGGMVV